VVERLVSVLEADARIAFAIVFGSRSRGSAHAGSDTDLASIIEISVAPEHQGKGLGRALMVASLHEMREERIARVELAVTAVNTPALRLYQSLGFEEVGEFAICVLPA
jgi:ribosomal protein S18 acetylase RimI-like enzyme